MRRPVLGFTLIELLVVIAIISILAVIGITIFTSVQRNARDARRKADVSSIANAFEVRYQNNGKYSAVVGTNFTSGSIPRDPDGVSDYYQALASDGSSFKVCAALDANATRVCTTESTTCFCSNSAQSTINGGATLDQIAGGAAPTITPTPLPTSIPPTPTPGCPAIGSLATGLVNSWKMNESPQTGPLSDSVGSFNLTVNGPSTNAVSGKVSNGHSFNGAFPSGDYLSTTSPVFPTGASSWNDFSISMWINPANLTSNMLFFAQEASTARSGDLGAYITNPSGWKIIVDRMDGGVPAPQHFDRISAPVSALTANSWNHVVITWSGGDNGIGKIYVGGVAQSVTSQNDFGGGASWSLPNFTIGGGYSGAPWQFSGTMDEVGVWSRTLSSTDVGSLNTRYQSGCSLP